MHYCTYLWGGGGGGRNFQGETQNLSSPTHPPYTCHCTDIRLNSLQYSELTERLLSPIRVAQSVIIHQSIADRFTVAFRDQVNRNGTYTQPAGAPVSHVTSHVTSIRGLICLSQSRDPSCCHVFSCDMCS